MSGPKAGRMIGITHDEDGNPIVEMPKILKVGIGLSKGKAITAWMNRDSKKPWSILVGYNEQNRKRHDCESKEAAIAKFEELYESAPMCSYPRKLPYFLFTVGTTAADGSQIFKPDWDAIEAHGPTPKSIEVVFMSDDPISGPGTGYRMWSATELKCKGDGIDALRVLSMAETPEEKALAAKAKADGEKYFPIVNGCWTRGCKYALPVLDSKGNPKKQCSGHMDIVFQLPVMFKIGGVSYLHTTSDRTARNVSGTLEVIKKMNKGRVSWIPMTMTVVPFKTNVGGKPGQAFMIVLQPTSEETKKLLSQFRTNMTQLGSPVADNRQIQAPDQGVVEPEILDSDEDDDLPISAENMEAEFGGVDDAPVVETVQSKTEDKTGELAAKLQARAAGAATSEATALPTKAAIPPPDSPAPEKKKGPLF